MSVGDPIRLGSAAGSRLIFQEGSSITVDNKGIQSCSVKALCPDGANVFNYLPAAGSSFATVFGNSYLPADFKVDITGGGYQIDYQKGRTALVTISFKRADPTNPGETARDKAKMSVKTAYHFVVIKNVSSTIFSPPLRIGIPEPVVTLTYNAVAPNLSGPVHALPSDPLARGFPDVPQLFFYSIPGQLFGQADPVGILLAYANPFWERTELDWDPVADQSFFGITESWQRKYLSIDGQDFNN